MNLAQNRGLCEILNTEKRRKEEVVGFINRGLDQTGFDDEKIRIDMVVRVSAGQVLLYMFYITIP